MIVYILDYMAKYGVYASSQKEQKLLEAGIAQYLLENGIDEEQTGEYYKKYVLDHLEKISVSDIKAYFINYSLISDANQIVIEYHCDGSVPTERKNDLYLLMQKLHSCGLGEKYVPIIEIKQILGKLS